jgi:hypothetical protein
MRQRIAASAIFGAALVLGGAACSRPDVVIIDSKAYSTYTGGNYVPGNPYPVWYCIEVSTGKVTNMGDKTAFGVSVKARFGSGAVNSAYVSCVNLKPADVGSFTVYGDTIGSYSGFDPPSTGPPVTAELSVSWR